MHQLDNTSLFTLRGLRAPGRVDIFGFGLVTLNKLTDAKLIEIYKSGRCPYLVPTNKGLEAMGIKPIRVKKTPDIKKSPSPKPKSKSKRKSKPKSPKT